MKHRYVQDLDINSLYPESIRILDSPHYELIEGTTIDENGDTWYRIRVYSNLVEDWILSQPDEKWDISASENYRGDSNPYWIHGSLYTFMILKWDTTCR